ncbi:hypothetical protein ENBRE01_0938 [Enteropsectra breve]|nr:hypothetical protein ENBRE01_0938 [Enteropsectra breve]
MKQTLQKQSFCTEKHAATCFIKPLPANLKIFVYLEKRSESEYLQREEKMLFYIMFFVFYPMFFSNAAWDTSQLESEDYRENLSFADKKSYELECDSGESVDSILDKKPFHCRSCAENMEMSSGTLIDIYAEKCLEDDSSDECVEFMNNIDDPFNENFACKKKQPISFAQIGKDSKIQEKNEEWPSKITKLVSIPKARSAVELSSDFMEKNSSGEILTLPYIGLGSCDSIKRVSDDVVAALLENKIKRDFVLVDARYAYEHEGGHIRGAINMGSDSNINSLFAQKKILIIYCEFSSFRAPTLAQRIRNTDRVKNMESYPFLSCPEIYVLKGGYSNFYKKYPELCDPMQYIKMHDKRFIEECAEEHKKRRMGKK